MIRLRPVLASSVAWAAGVVTAVAVGIVALSLIRTSFTADAFQPIRPNAAGQTAPATEPSPPPPSGAGPTGPAGSASPRSSPSPAERQFTTAGGTVVATCRSGQAYLLYWTPQPGFRTDDVARGPALVARVTFESSSREVDVSITCAGGVPQSTIQSEERDSGGHGGSGSE